MQKYRVPFDETDPLAQFILRGIGSNSAQLSPQYSSPFRPARINYLFVGIYYNESRFRASLLAYLEIDLIDIYRSRREQE